MQLTDHRAIVTVILKKVFFISDTLVLHFKLRTQLEHITWNEQ